jgi:hypothetical protein
MKLMHLKKGGGNYAAFYFAGKRVSFIYIYEVFTWAIFLKTGHYSLLMSRGLCRLVCPSRTSKQGRPARLTGPVT